MTDQADRDAAEQFLNAQRLSILHNGRALSGAFAARAEAAADERQAAIVAWLREQYSGKLQSAVYLADTIERGDWKGQG